MEITWALIFYYDSRKTLLMLRNVISEGSLNTKEKTSPRSSHARWWEFQETVTTEQGIFSKLDSYNETANQQESLESTQLYVASCKLF